MSNLCPKCGGDTLTCLAGRNAHASNWYCTASLDGIACGYKAWVTEPEAPRFIEALPSGVHIVAMTIWNDELIIATNEGIYKMIGDKLMQMRFEVEAP